MFKAATAWIDRIRARRARHLVLVELLTMDAHRLYDLGITTDDILRAIADENHPLRPTESLPTRQMIAPRRRANAALRG